MRPLYLDGPDHINMTAEDICAYSVPETFKHFCTKSVQFLLSSWSILSMMDAYCNDYQ